MLQYMKGKCMEGKPFCPSTIGTFRIVSKAVPVQKLSRNPYASHIIILAHVQASDKLSCYGGRFVDDG